VSKRHAKMIARADRDEWLRLRLFSDLDPRIAAIPYATTLFRWAEHQNPPVSYHDAKTMVERGIIECQYCWGQWIVRLDPAIVERLGLEPAVLMAAWCRPQP